MKITKDELTTIQELHTLVSIHTERLAELFIQKTVLDDMLKNAQGDFLKSVSDEEQYASELEKKYGTTGLLDIETGEIKTS